MKKLFYYLVIRCTTRHAETAIKIYQSIYHSENGNPVINITKTESVNNQSKQMNVVGIQSIPNKKQEIVDSLNYLKSKKVKTKQDKDSIYSLEMVLKNM
jgi:hypothetical protein